MSSSLLDSLAQEIAHLLAPLARVVQNPGALDMMLGEIGVIAGAEDEALVEALTTWVDLTNELEALAAQPSPSFASITAVLDVSQRALEAVRRLSDVNGPMGAPQSFGQDLANLLIVAYLAGKHPVTRDVAALLTLLEPVEEVEAQPPLIQDGRLLRKPFRLDRFHLDRLGNLLRDPVVTLRAEYGNALATADDANAMASKLFPRLVRLLRDLGVSCRYGFNPGDEELLGDAAPLMDHALIIYADDPLHDAVAESGVVISISSADRGDLGLVVSPFGVLTSSRQAGRWAIELTVTAGVDVVAYGRHGLTLLANAETTEVAGSLSATLASLDDEPGFVFGAPDGTRIEVGGARLGIDTTLSEARQSLVLSADVSSSAVVIAPGDGDAFLRSILPAEGMRADFALGLAWSNETGLLFRGSAGLDATLPIGLSIGGVTLSTVHLSLQARDASVLAEVSASFAASIGPVHAVIDRVGIATAVTFPEVGGNLGVADLEVGFKPPTGLGLLIDAGPVTGGGFLRFDPERAEYAGEVYLEFEGILVRAVGLLTTRLPGGGSGFSLLVVISAEFPPVQLGLGFRLVGVGGLVGINRTVAVEALRGGLKTGALGAVLSPPDPVANAAQLVASVAGLFPPAVGRHVFGPVARIEWGSPTLITIDVCLVLELPAPVRLVVLGRLRAVLPDEREAIVRIQMDLLGVVDFDRHEAAVDATLVDSRLAQFALTGDMALRMSWGPRPSFLLAVGGFHPRFAAPPGFPALGRVAIALASGENPKLRLEAYLALTSNTIQLGARVDLFARAGRFSVAGFLSFDALVTLQPLAFTVDIAAKLAVKVGGRTLLSVSLRLTLSGPQPWRARGRASFSILFFDISFGFDITIGDDAPPGLPSPVDVAALLLAAFTDTRSWSAQLPAGGAALVTLRALEPGSDVLAHPLGTLEVRQRVAPLERTLQRFGSSVPSGARHFTIAGATIGRAQAAVSGVQDLFAPAQFQELSDEQKLSLPSFESMPSGAVIGAREVAHGTPVNVSVVYEQKLVTALGESESERVAIPGDVFIALTATPPPSPATFAMTS
ncbi:MAG: DUF6603 domain-containing protein [Pseudonocardiaceae bacterium]